MPGAYRLAYVDLHWGGEDTRGSEHTVDTQAFAMEVCEMTETKYLLKGLINKRIRHEISFPVPRILLSFQEDESEVLMYIQECL